MRGPRLILGTWVLDRSALAVLSHPQTPHEDALSHVDAMPNFQGATLCDCGSCQALHTSSCQEGSARPALALAASAVFYLAF